MLPAFIVVNTMLAGVLVVAWVRMMSPRFQRFPDRLRMYGTIDVPPLSAPESIGPTALGGGDGGGQRATGATA